MLLMIMMDENSVIVDNGNRGACEEKAQLCYDILADVDKATIKYIDDLDEKASKLFHLSVILAGIFLSFGGIILRDNLPKTRLIYLNISNESSFNVSNVNSIYNAINVSYQ